MVTSFCEVTSHLAGSVAPPMASANGVSAATTITAVWSVAGSSGTVIGSGLKKRQASSAGSVSVDHDSGWTIAASVAPSGATTSQVAVGGTDGGGSTVGAGVGRGGRVGAGVGVGVGAVSVSGSVSESGSVSGWAMRLARRSAVHSAPWMVRCPTPVEPGLPGCSRSGRSAGASRRADPRGRRPRVPIGRRSPAP